METIKLKLPVDEIRYRAYGERVGEERIIKKNEVSEDEWNYRINNLIFDHNPGSEGLHCKLYNNGFEVFSGMLDWDCIGKH
mgnify:FL=1